MVNITQINSDLLSKIFQHVPSIKQLAQCSQVAKSWESPATNEMFSRKIRIQSEWTALRLYRHIFVDPTKAKYIKHLHFELNEPDFPYVYDQLLRLAITPSIQKVTGSVKTERFYITLSQIMEGPPMLVSLTEIPTFTGEAREWKSSEMLDMQDRILSLCPTLDSNTIKPFREIIWQLKFYEYTTSLDLTASVDFASIEPFLNCCSRLKAVRFSDLLFPYYTDIKKATEEFNFANVQVQPLVETVIIKSKICAYFVNYLVRKYPNIKKIELEGQWLDWLDLDFCCLGRTLDTIKHIKYKKAAISLPRYTLYTNAVKFQQKRTENIQYHVESDGAQEKLILKIGY